MDDELILLLRVPVTVAGETITELRLTEPTYDQLVKSAKAGATPLEQVGALINLNAKVPQAVVSQLRQRDLTEAADFFGRFSDLSKPTPTASGT